MYRHHHSDGHQRDLLRLSSIFDAVHLQENEFAQSMKQSKTTITMKKYSFDLLLAFLQENQFLTLLKIVNQYIKIEGKFCSFIH
jgi:transcription initiation factor TFIID subunit 5